MAEKKIIAARYTVLNEAKRGGTAQIFKAFDLESHRVVALKIYATRGRDPAVVNEIWNRECSALSVLTHDCVVQMIDAGRDPDTDGRYIALEWIDGQTLEVALAESGALKWETFMERFGHQILSALLFAADKNIIHRDLSPGNVLVTPSGQIKIIDFGQARLGGSVGIGLTVRDWRTAPYCLPEDDTGRFTETRDPFAFCALAVRAMCGHSLSNHEELYAAHKALDLPPRVREVTSRALSRIPEDRYPTTVEFERELQRQEYRDPEAAVRLRLPLRFAPDALEIVAGTASEAGISANDLILEELNDVVAIAPAGSPNNPKIDLETASFRLTGSPSKERDHLVIEKVIRKYFRIDQMYRSDHWLVQADFTTALPVRQADKQDACSNLQRLYACLEVHLNELAASKRGRADGVFDEWSKVLDALRYLAQNSVPALRYTRLEIDGSRIVAAVDNPEDATEQELRVISSGGRWLFRGEVESVRDYKCTLIPTRPFSDLDLLPPRGTLDIDWAQTKVALDRQARALERFRSGDSPSPAIKSILIGEEKGSAEQSFSKIGRFFDKNLDSAKRVIVSRFMAGPPLMVAHGPPGTGKTKLIVEIIRQELAANPDSKILLASQTHAALDNALERLLSSDAEVPCVRIGSGSKEADPRVAATSLVERSKQLRDKVSMASRAYIELRASEWGVDKREVELGLGALELLGTKEALEGVQRALVERGAEAETIKRAIVEEKGETRTRNEALARARALEDELEELRGEEVIAKAEVETARRALVNVGKDGAELARLNAGELREWAEMLLSNPEHRSIGDLMQLAKEWKARFDQSDDFKVAIISSSSVVAGTCVGFCREEASLRTVFDLCIVDEAGKATTAELLVPLAQSRRALLLGDHHQLPAVLDHDVRSREMADRFGLNSRQIEVQLFEQLTTDLNDGAKVALTEQHRMRGAIGRLVSDCFYDSKLTEGDSIVERGAPSLAIAGLETEVSWLDPYVGKASGACESARGTSFENACESQAIVALLKRISFALEAQKGRWRPSIAVISGYAPQVSLVKSSIRKETALDGLKIECASVHAFQGREVDICIYGVTRKNRDGKIGMLSDWRHLNVALSRARDFLVIVGSLDFCRSVRGANPFAKVIGFVERDSDCSIREWADA